MIKQISQLIAMFLVFIVTTGKALAFGSLGGLSTTMSGSTLAFDYPMSISINIPSGTSLRPSIPVPTTPVMMPSVNFDATQIPVHELPPLPLTLDEPE